MNQEASFDTAKIVLLGPMGCGKTTAIRSISDGGVVSTEAPMTVGASAEKSTTTVAMDFSTVTLDDGTPLFVYGVPGQQSHEFMRPIVLSGAIGTIVMLSAEDPELGQSCRHWLDEVAKFAPSAAVVVGVTHADVAPHFSMKALRHAVAEAGPPRPIFTFDARDREQTQQLMRALVISANIAT
jgi:uncharacterized protein